MCPRFNYALQFFNRFRFPHTSNGSPYLPRPICSTTHRRNTANAITFKGKSSMYLLEKLNLAPRKVKDVYLPWLPVYCATITIVMASFHINVPVGINAYNLANSPAILMEVNWIQRSAGLAIMGSLSRKRSSKFGLSLTFDLYQRQSLAYQRLSLTIAMGWNRMNWENIIFNW